MVLREDNDDNDDDNDDDADDDNDDRMMSEELASVVKS